MSHKPSSVLLLPLLLLGCPVLPDPPTPSGDDDDSAPLGAGDDDSAEPPLGDTGVEINVPLGTPDAIGIRLEIEGTAILDWTTVAPGEHYTIEPLAIGWYDLLWEGAGTTGIAQVEVCEGMVTEVGVPASLGAVFACE